MKITDIKKQVKRDDRYSIFGDGKYIFSLSENELLKLGLKVNQEINTKELEDLKSTAEEDKAYDRALNLIMRRPRSEWEMRTYLRQKGYETEMTETVVNRLSDSGYLDDLDFAKRWIENRRLLKQTSKRKLELELKQKRVSDEALKQAIGDDVASEIEVLKELISKKRSQSRYKDEQKLIAYLARQGFHYDDIKTALSDLQD